MPDVQRPAWSAAIFGRNEAPTIDSCLAALAGAAHGLDIEVAVMLNGCTDDSAAIACRAMQRLRLSGLVCTIPFADKSNAINAWLHRIAPAAETYVCIDAYAAIRPDALRLLGAALDATPHALAAAAMPSTGPSAARLRRDMERHHGLHGSLFALRGDFVARLRVAGLRLPVGLYRGDGLLGAMVLQDLDGVGNAWDESRIVLVPGASWATPPLRPWRPTDLRRALRRQVRQARGRLESAAIRDTVHRAGFAGLPDDANRMIADWVAGDPAARAPRPYAAPLGWLALREARAAAPPDPARLQPTEVARFPRPAQSGAGPAPAAGPAAPPRPEAA